MSARKEPPPAFLEAADGPILVGIINQMAEAFDVEELSLEAALLLYWITDRIQTALWRRYPAQLLQVLIQTMAAIEEDDEDEPDGSEGANEH